MNLHSLQGQDMFHDLAYVFRPRLRCQLTNANFNGREQTPKTSDQRVRDTPSNTNERRSVKETVLAWSVLTGLEHVSRRLLCALYQDLLQAVGRQTLARQKSFQL